MKNVIQCVSVNQNQFIIQVMFNILKTIATRDKYLDLEVSFGFQPLSNEVTREISGSCIGSCVFETVSIKKF